MSGKTEGDKTVRDAAGKRLGDLTLEEIELGAQASELYADLSAFAAALMSLSVDPFELEVIARARVTVMETFSGHGRAPIESYLRHRAEYRNRLAVETEMVRNDVRTRQS